MIPIHRHYHKNGILVVDKPSGLPSQPTKDQDNNLYDQLRTEFPYLALHHRLDTPVSGLLLLCTQKKWNKAIAQAFQNHEIKRGYWAVCLGQTPPQGIWDWNIQGKHARTIFKTQYFADGWSVLHLSLETGRMHQIRKHAMMSGHPILGDRRYGGAASKLCPRIALHAHTLSFIHPATQDECKIISPLPPPLALYTPHSH